jgi:hypothetical protein
LDWLEPLTALGDDQRAKAVFDELIANPAAKEFAPGDERGERT